MPTMLLVCVFISLVDVLVCGAFVFSLRLCFIQRVWRTVVCTVTGGTHHRVSEECFAGDGHGGRSQLVSLRQASTVACLAGGAQEDLFVCADSLARSLSA